MGILERILSLFTQDHRKKQNGNRHSPKQEQSKSIVGQRGRVVRREEAGTIEAEGITLKASIEVRTYTEEETNENAEEERIFFEPAFWKVAKSIQASEESLKALLPELLMAFTSGDPRRETQAVMLHLPEGTWRWPAYEDYVSKRDGDDIKKETELIKRSGLSDLLNRLTVSELRTLYKQHSGEIKKSPGRKKSDIVASLMKSISNAATEPLAESLRTQFIRDIEEPGDSDYREMCSMFARKVAMTAYGVRHRAQMLELKDMSPQWRFIADDREGMPDQCRKFNGILFRYDDPFWDTHYPPCEWPECSCRVELKMR